MARGNRAARNVEPWGNTGDAEDSNTEPCAMEARDGVPTKGVVGDRIGDGVDKNNAVEEGGAKCDAHNTAAGAEPNRVEVLE